MPRRASASTSTPRSRTPAALQSHEYDGVALTYAQVASKPSLHRRRTEDTPTLVILDEIHHGGDALSWGDAIREAFDPAARRLSLTGTPFRSDTDPIPFVRYEMGHDGILPLRGRLHLRVRRGAARRRRAPRAVPRLRRGDALAHQGRRRGRGPARRAAHQGRDGPGLAHRAGPRRASGCPSVLAAADKRLSEVRRHVPDAGGLVIASNQTSARAYAKILARDHGRGADGRALRRRRRQRRDRASSPQTPPAGWSRCGWCPRASTCRACASGSTRRRPRPRCSSPRPSAASCGPAGAARRHPSSCPRSR